MNTNPNFVVIGEVDDPEYREEKAPLALAILVGVILAATIDLLPIVIAALLGVILMALTGVLKAHELYEAVDWPVIFLLAGVIPLGMALEQTGGAGWIGVVIASTGDYLPGIAVLWLFYRVTGLFTVIISNNASVVFMIRMAIEAAGRLGANPLAFLLIVMFAASTAFMTPIGYQTNLFVYGPGGYRFSDFLRVGAPLQLLLSIVTVAGVYLFWGL